MWAANVRGVFYLSQLAARYMAKRRHGSIINVSSILAHQTIKNRTIYAATKGALNSLTHAMALELIPYNIRVNAVVPGPFRTEALLAGVSDPELQQQIQRHIPSGRFGEPDELARVIVFLASDASSYVTGALLPVDGGLSSREAVPPS
jgi:NAD(P)-dependent dehydrogenase (short-subunit alcohol dehydrogenase family)